MMNSADFFSNETREQFRNGVRYLYEEEPCSSVGVVSDYGVDDRAIEVRSPAEAKGFFL
jgi:hypothetical protein